MKKQNLIQIIRDQASIPLPKRLIPRWESLSIEPFINNRQVIIFSGIRRCGKSTLLQIIRSQAQESHYSINFDDDRLVPFTVDDFQLLIDIFVELYGIENTFYFDEIQNIPGWERFVRRLHNEGKKVFITGSNASLLSSELGTHLTGRHITITLFPYSFKEYLFRENFDIKPKQEQTSTYVAVMKKHFSEFMKLGGMPEYLESQQKQYLHSLYESILYKDIIVRHKLPQERPLKEMVYYLASNNTKKFTYNAVRKLLGLSNAKTIAEYCSYLENSFLCFIINRFSYSVKQQVYNAKKVYFIDQALAESVGFRFSEDQGRTLENIVFLQLRRKTKEVYFHQGKHECDFILRDGHTVSQAIQVSVSLQNEKTKQREYSGLLEAMVEYQLSEGLIITADEAGEEIIVQQENTYKIIIKPCWQWLE